MSTAVGPLALTNFVRKASVLFSGDRKHGEADATRLRFWGFGG